MSHLLIQLLLLIEIFIITCWSNQAFSTEITPPRPINDRGVISTSSSPYAKLHDVPIHAIKLGDGFWKPRMEANKQKSIPALLKLLEDHGVVDNFRRLSGRKNVERRGFLFTDSDLFKWMEAVAFVLQSDNDPALKATLDNVIDDVLAGQGKDGYLNTYHVDALADKRFSNFRGNHELYCLGHLIQAAIAYYRAAGDRKLLDGAIRYADYVLNLFGPGKRQCFPGHPEIEMAMVELYRTTGEKKYLDFVNYLYTGIDVNQLNEKVAAEDFMILFTALPFTSIKEFRSHAVRGMYASCGAADYYMETGNREFRRTLETLWQDMSRYKMYVTGGVGSRYSGEAFANAYELPNERAYTETCAAIGNIMWNWRLLNATGEARFADVMERALYNGFLSGVSLEGDYYFYRNPLASLGDNERQPWYECTCCPPNVERTLASLPGYFYSTSPEGLWIHFYHSNTLSWRLESGSNITLTQKTCYPWENTVALAIDPETEADFTLFLRIPDWTARATVTVNDNPKFDIGIPGSYCEIKRTWKKGDIVHVAFDMPVQIVRANPRLREDFGSIAIQRGPVVYCLESPDHRNVSIFDVVVPLNSSNPSDGFTSQLQPELLGGIIVINKEANIFNSSLKDAPLYRFSPFPAPTLPVKLTAIPYYAWANRGRSEMEVWIPAIEGK
ncbi:MAG: glycoside hydrolase family 127 protein [Patescibacteria group bacterium]|nr:glycoside hydrolase family 127 protein [Patescibacteria group bacterium]